jgi:hypothetical protein
MSSPPNDYETGYGKPPKESQFKPSQSGNPKGRPKARGSQQIDLDKLLGDPVRARTSKGTILMDPFEAQIRKQLELGLKGSIQAIEYVLNAFSKYESIVPAERSIHWGVRVMPPQKK